MYGAKATAIQDVAVKVWVPGKTPSTRTKTAIERAVFALDAEGEGYDLTTDVDFPADLNTPEFKRLVIALAAGALVA